MPIPHTHLKTRLSQFTLNEGFKYSNGLLIIISTTPLTIKNSDKCLVINGKHTFLTTCVAYDNRNKWRRGKACQHTSYTSTEQSLLLQHRQYLDDRVVDGASLESKIKRIDCEHIQVRRVLTTFLAETSGLLAVKANKLPI